MTVGCLNNLDLSKLKAKRKQEEATRIEREMEALRIRKEEEEKQRLFIEEKNKLMGAAAGYHPQIPPDVSPPKSSSNHSLYPSNQVPAYMDHTRASAKYTV